jgi:hypothetical protein
VSSQFVLTVVEQLNQHPESILDERGMRNKREREIEIEK